MPRRGERKYTTMMLYPAMNSLTKNVPNRYLLVNVVARRARQIAEDAEMEGIHLTEKPVTEAINEVADGEITADARERVQGELRRAFRPEFLNRLDEILMFRPLTRDNLSHIIDNLVAALRSRLADRTLNLEMTDAAKALIIENGYDPVYGARPLKRYLQSHAETLIARTILSGDLHAGDTLVVDAENGALVCRVKA